MKLGRLYYRDRMYEKAAQKYTRIIQLLENSIGTPKPFFELGTLLERLGRQDEAKEIYLKALEYNPGDRKSAIRLDALQKGD